MRLNWSIRFRMTLWYIVALLAILIIFGGIMSAMMRRQLRQQMDSGLIEETKELIEEVGKYDSIEEVKSAFAKRPAEHGGFSFQVCLSDGTIICGTPWLAPHHLNSLVNLESSRNFELQDVTLDRFGAHRVCSKSTLIHSQSVIFQVLVPYTQLTRSFSEFQQILVISGGIALMISCIGGWSIAHRALRPIERLTLAAERISAENLSMKIEVDCAEDELGRLAATLNQTFKKLNASVNQLRKFTGDVAHELRTPLTVLRTHLEVALRIPDASKNPQKSFEVALQQSDQLSRIIDQLLLLSRQEAGVIQSTFDDVELRPLLEDVVEVLKTTADSKQVALSIDPIPDVAIRGDDISLSRLFYNLIDNAVKYTAASGTVHVTATVAQHFVQVQIKDSGKGIRAEEIPNLFERFYRGEAGYSHKSSGTGLGLAICRSIVESHGGTIEVSSIVSQGSVFTVALPILANWDVRRSIAEAAHA